MWLWRPEKPKKMKKSSKNVKKSESCIKMIKFVISLKLIHGQKRFSSNFSRPIRDFQLGAKF